MGWVEEHTALRLRTEDQQLDKKHASTRMPAPRPVGLDCTGGLV